MLVEQLKNIVHILWQRKELLVIYCFEEYLCNVFLSADIINHYQTGNWTDYLGLSPYCLCLIVGLAISHLSKKQEPNFRPKNTIFRVLLGKLQRLQQRFPLSIALLSIALVITGEIVEQQVLESINHILITQNYALTFFAFTITIATRFMLAFLICFPIITGLVFLFTGLQIGSNRGNIKSIIPDFSFTSSVKTSFRFQLNHFLGRLFVVCH